MNPTKNILIFHPEQAVCDQLSTVANNLNIHTEFANNIDDVIETSQLFPWDMVFISTNIDGNCLSINTIKQLKKKAPACIIILLAEKDHENFASKSLAHGAYDYLLIPCNQHHIKQLIARAFNAHQYSRELVAESDSSQSLFKAAHFAAQADVSVLISGESGTGKEVVAQFIHNYSLRSEGPFVAINCAAIPENMVESILFGHAKGAFTGAINTTQGKLEQANGGTLFLDEIGELPLSMQAKLLRVLQERKVERLGCHKVIPLNIRIVAATNKDLSALVSEGKFRDDLFYRLNVFPLCCKPLRERKEDIIPLTEHILKRHHPNVDYTLTAEATEALIRYQWPGNVRELDNVIQRALVMTRGCFIGAEQLMLPSIETVKEKPKARANISLTYDKPRLHESRKKAEFETIINTLKQFGGHRNKTAQELGLSSRALRYKIQTMKEQGLDIELILAASSDVSFVNNYGNFEV